jgi:carboxypeptidase Q
MRRAWFVAGLGLAVAGAPVAAPAQTFTGSEPVLEAIWREGTDRSQLERLAQALLDSVGPRLNSSPEHLAGNNWLIAQYAQWGVQARNEQYGTWRRWRRGVSHIDLLEPRVRSLEGMLLAWSPGTRRPVTAGVVTVPRLRSPAEFEAWLPSVRGQFVAVSFPQPTCRPDANWQQYATPASFQRMRTERARALAAWDSSLAASGLQTPQLHRRLEAAGAVGILTSNWPNAWGVTRIFNGRTERIPTVDLSCEDYGLVSRLAISGQRPRVRINAEAEWLGTVPAFNTIAEIRGSELPDEYVMLSAHFDTWDGASGATDNGTGTVLMMEAIRILRQVYPNPRRTILVGHWGGEEQGLNGSRAFVQDHPQVVQGLQALFNQDNGTGRVVNISMQGFTEAGEHWGRWLSRVPREITQHISLDLPGTPGAGGTDHAAFVCAGAPAFNLSALSWDYSPYTWHTNRDTYDKIVFDDLRNNAILVAMLTYLASEDPERVSRERRTVFPVSPFTGQPGSWPACQPPARSWEESARVR